MSDRDTLFTSIFWRSFQRAMGTDLAMGTAYHPQSDCQTERLNLVIEDMLRACIIDFGGSWEDHLPLVEFAYNNSYHSSIGMAPFEALYGRPCRSPSCWSDVGDKAILGPDMVRETTERVELIKQRMRAAQSRQASYANPKRRKVEFFVGDLVFLKISPMKGVMRFGFKGKLSPRYVGPYPVISVINENAYAVELPASMSGIHNVFHVSMLRRCVRDSDTIVQPTELEISDDLTYKVRPMKIVAMDVKLTRRSSIDLVKVQWSEDPRDATWEMDEKNRREYPELYL